MVKMEAYKPVYIDSFLVKQVIGGLEMGRMDEPLLKYIDFFSSLIPIKSAYFLHVVPRFDLFRSLFEKDSLPLAGQYVLSKNVIKQLAININANLSKDRGIDVDYDVREGNPLEEILRDAEEVGSDLVIIGQKKETKTHGILAKKLARNVKCNALIVPENSKHSLKKILIPIDFSDYSVKALQTAIAINKQLEEPAEIICVNVYELPDFASYNISKTREQFRQMMEKDRIEAFEAFLQTYVPNEKEQIQKVVLQKEIEWTPHYIMKYANDNEVDFMVMGAKGHSKITLLMMGSVTEKLLSINDSIPTLIVK